jgi:hypothetical protein
VIVLGVDDLLIAVVRPRMRPGAPESVPQLGGQGEQPATAIALGRDRRGQVSPPARANLDLRGDQLPGDRLGQHRIIGRRRAKALEPGREGQVGIEHRELLLQAHGEVRGLLEDLPGSVEVENHVAVVGGAIR